MAGPRRRRRRALGLALPLLAACQPQAAPHTPCPSIGGQRYCFDDKIAYLPNAHGILLELPLGALDAPCNRSRRLYKQVFVLFSDDPLPDLAALRRNARDWDPGTTVRDIAPADAFFAASRREYEECRPSKGGPPRTDCTRFADWKGARLEFPHDGQCTAEARRFAADLEALIEGARR